KDHRHYFKPLRKSGFCLTMLDIDEHNGETDGFEAVQYLLSLFPNCYWEASPQGFHLYPMFRVIHVKRSKFNEILRQLETHLKLLFEEQNFKCGIEVKGTFALLDQYGEVIDGQRGSLASIPLLSNG